MVHFGAVIRRVLLRYLPFQLVSRSGSKLKTEKASSDRGATVLKVYEKVSLMPRAS